MEITWLGHAAFLLRFEDLVILMDPFLSQNPQTAHLDMDNIINDVTHIALTHGHADHLGDTINIAKEKKVPVIVNADLGAWLTAQGIENVLVGNTGGTISFEKFTVTFAHALHSSAFLTDNGVSLSLGAANGLIFHFKNAPCIYHMGDTDIFSDMALIEELHKPEIAFVPIGDRFTMGAAVAALACQRYFNFKAVIPCHYGTFPLLDSSAEKFVRAMQYEKTKVFVPKIGEVLPF